MAFSPIPGPLPVPQSSPAPQSAAGPSPKAYLMSIVQKLPNNLDAQEESVIAKAAALLKGLEAGRQKEKESAMGTTASHKFVARHTQGGAGY